MVIKIGFALTQRVCIRCNKKFDSNYYDYELYCPSCNPAFTKKKKKRRTAMEINEIKPKPTSKRPSELGNLPLNSRQETNDKAIAIIKSIVDKINSENHSDVCFAYDWYGNSLTVYVDNKHTHVGTPDSTLEQLIDDLYGLLCENRGLSWQR